MTSFEFYKLYNDNQTGGCKLTVYIDIILLENICMNYIILFATAYVMKIKRNFFLIVVSSSIGAIYSAVLYLKIIPIYSSIIMKILLSIIMTYIAFKPSNIITSLKQLIVFYLVSFAFGGCAFFLLYFIKPEEIFIKNGVFIGIYPLKIAVLGGLVGFVILHLSFKVVKNKIKKEQIYFINIKLNENICDVYALLDTGNMLKDPLTQKPVLVVEKNKIQNLFPKQIIQNTDQIIGGDIKVDEVSRKYISKFKIIPYNSIGKQNGILLGFKPDLIEVKIDDINYEIKDVIIGIFEGSFNSNKYNALIGNDILDINNKKII